MKLDAAGIALHLRLELKDDGRSLNATGKEMIRQDTLLVFIQPCAANPSMRIMRRKPTLTETYPEIIFPEQFMNSIGSYCIYCI